jgi:hypothetical protein
MRSHMNSRRSRGPKLPGPRIARRSRDGMTEAILPAHGFMVDILVDLIRAGLATATLLAHPANGRGRRVADRCAPRRMMTHCIFFQPDLVINFAQTRLGTRRYIFAITDSGPESGAGGRETGRAPA